MKGKTGGERGRGADRCKVNFPCCCVCVVSNLQYGLIRTTASTDERCPPSRTPLLLCVLCVSLFVAHRERETGNLKVDRMSLVQFKKKIEPIRRETIGGSPSPISGTGETNPPACVHPAVKRWASHVLLRVPL
jgi:hypothetical protein